MYQKFWFKREITPNEPSVERQPLTALGAISEPQHLDSLNGAEFEVSYVERFKEPEDSRARNCELQMVSQIKCSSLRDSRSSRRVQRANNRLVKQSGRTGSVIQRMNSIQTSKYFDAKQFRLPSPSIYLLLFGQLQNTKLIANDYKWIVNALISLFY